jgi:O-antigen ligase
LTGLGWTLIACLALAPLAALIPVQGAFAYFGETAPASWLQRLSIWKVSAARIFDGLPFGYGADSTRIWHKTTPMIDIPGAPGPLPASGVHPHNLFLQVWLELGLPGVIALGAFIYCAAAILMRAHFSRGVAAAIGGAVVVFFGTFMVGGSLWEVWRFASIALAAMGAALAHALERTLRD